MAKHARYCTVAEIRAAVPDMPGGSLKYFMAQAGVKKIPGTKPVRAGALGLVANKYPVNSPAKVAEIWAQSKRNKLRYQRRSRQAVQTSTVRVA